ncbi:MAG: hypothetical protein AAFX55_14275 [Bacteroidota bacterium]
MAFFYGLKVDKTTQRHGKKPMLFKGTKNAKLFWIPFNKEVQMKFNI